jgi:hypothetical protein
MEQFTSGRVRIADFQDKELFFIVTESILESVAGFEYLLRSCYWEPRRMTVKWRGRRFNMRVLR